jgi:PAS domain S-box-containing protein
LAIQHDRIEGLAQALFEEVGEALFLFEPEGLRILDANSAAQRLSGFGLPRLLGRSLDDLFSSENPSHPQDLESAARKPTPFRPVRYFLQTIKRGVRVPVTLTFARLHVTPQTLGLVTARDARPQCEPEANDAADLQSLMASVPDCLWSGMIDDSGQLHYYYLSPAIQEIAGQPPAFFAEDSKRWEAIVHSEDREVWAQARGQLFRGQSTRIDYRILRPDGTWARVNERIQVTKSELTLQLCGIITELSEK